MRLKTLPCLAVLALARWPVERGRKPLGANRRRNNGRSQRYPVGPVDDGIDAIAP